MTLTTAITKTDVDTYISLKKQADDLDKQIKELQVKFKIKGVASHPGTRGIVEVSEAAGRKTTDWDKVQTFVRIPEDVLAKCTKTGESSFRMTIKPL